MYVYCLFIFSLVSLLRIFIRVIVNQETKRDATETKQDRAETKRNETKRKKIINKLKQKRNKH